MVMRIKLFPDFSWSDPEGVDARSPLAPAPERVLHGFGFVGSEEKLLSTRERLGLLGAFVRDAEKRIKDREDSCRSLVHSWLRVQTREEVQNLFPPGSFNSVDRLVVENAFHFGRIDDDTITLSLAGDGLDPGPAVGIGERNGNDKDYDGEYPDSCSGPSRTRWKAKLRDFRPLNCRILRTQFQGKRIQMLTFVPDTIDDLEHLEANFAESFDLSDFLKEDAAGEEEETDVTLELPRFRIEDCLLFNEDLKSLGIRDVFGSSSTDFEGLCREKLEQVDEVSDVDPLFSCHRPFLFLVVDSKTSLVVFAGRVTDPNSDDEDEEEDVDTEEDQK